jgi:hypothetical protein
MLMFVLICVKSADVLASICMFAAYTFAAYVIAAITRSLSVIAV